MKFIVKTIQTEWFTRDFSDLYTNCLGVYPKDEDDCVADRIFMSREDIEYMRMEHRRFLVSLDLLNWHLELEMGQHLFNFAPNDSLQDVIKPGTCLIMEYENDQVQDGQNKKRTRRTKAKKS